MIVGMTFVLRSCTLSYHSAVQQVHDPRNTYSIFARGVRRAQHLPETFRHAIKRPPLGVPYTVPAFRTRTITSPLLRGITFCQSTHDIGGAMLLTKILSTA